MKPHEISALCDGALALLRAAEEAERDPAKFDESALRVPLEALLRAALPLYTLKDITRVALAGALEHNGGNATAAAQALGVTRAMFYGNRPYRRQRGKASAA